MITAANLKSRTVKDLAALAKRKRGSRLALDAKRELVKALVKHARRTWPKRPSDDTNATHLRPPRKPDRDARRSGSIRSR